MKFKPLDDESKLLIAILFLEKHKISKISLVLNIKKITIIAYLNNLINGRRKISTNNSDINDLDFCTE